MTITATMPGYSAPYAPHPLHGEDRPWPKTITPQLDLWIELLHSRRLEPLACLAFTLGLDFEGDQFTYLGFPERDVRALYGIEVQRFDLWRPITVHAAEQTALGQVLLVEADAFYLPDTAGVSYRYEHAKTLIAIASIDTTRCVLHYFHGRGFHALGGNDYDGLFRLGEFAGDVSVLPPFAEIVKLEGVRALVLTALTERSLALTRFHLAGAPKSNPVVRYAVRVPDDVAWLQQQPLAIARHYLAMTVCRVGACFDLTSSFLQWLQQHGQRGLAEAAAAFGRISVEANVVHRELERMVRLKRDVDVGPQLVRMAGAWDEGMSRLTDRFAR